MKPMHKAKCEVALKVLLEDKNGSFFLNKIDERKDNVPNYYQIIRAPLNLTQIKRKLKLGLIDSVDQFVDDIRYIYTSYMKYYKINSNPQKVAMAQEILKKFYMEMKKQYSHPYHCAGIEFKHHLDCKRWFFSKRVVNRHKVVCYKNQKTKIKSYKCFFTDCTEVILATELKNHLLDHLFVSEDKEDNYIPTFDEIIETGDDLKTLENTLLSKKGIYQLLPDKPYFREYYTNSRFKKLWPSKP